jgi:hypothetical protein
MEQAQLFKRLHIMTMNEISSFNKSHEEISMSLFKLDAGSRSRHIIENIQLEEMWQAQSETSKNFEIFLKMKFSPQALSACWDFNEDMNVFSWHFVFPKYEDIDKEAKPNSFGEYLKKLIRVEIPDIDVFDIEHACTFIDFIYDFQAPLGLPPNLDH